MVSAVEAPGVEEPTKVVGGTGAVAVDTASAGDASAKKAALAEASRGEGKGGRRGEVVDGCQHW